MSEIAGRFAVTVEQVDSFDFRARFDNKQFPPLLHDEPPPIGHDHGPNAVRILAAAIGNCVAASLVCCLKNAGVPTHGVRADVQVEVMRNDAHRLRVHKVDVTLHTKLRPDDPALASCLATFGGALRRHRERARKNGCRADGTTARFDLLVSFPAYIAAQRYDALPSDDHSFLRTDARTRQVEGNPDIYAVGDASDFPVKQAFLALLQADAVGEHIAERILGEDPVAAFDPVSMCIMEQFDKATFAQVPLRLTGDPAHPVVVREDAMDMYRVGCGSIWRVGKKMLGVAIPERFAAGRPFHAGATWAVMDAGLKVMTAAFTD